MLQKKLVKIQNFQISINDLKRVKQFENFTTSSEYNTEIVFDKNFNFFYYSTLNNNKIKVV